MAKKKSEGQSGGISFNTSGGKVHIGGDAVAGDKIGGNVVGRDNVGGDVVGHDKITTTGISGSELAELVKQFQQVNKRIDDAPVAPDVKVDLKENVKKIEEEVKKGEQADPSKVERWLKFIAGMSEDIAQVVGATLLNPALGIGTAIRLIAQKAKDSQ